LGHIYGTLLLLLRQWVVDLVAVDVEVEKTSVLGLVLVKLSCAVLKALESFDLLLWNVLSAVNHHLG
jgi:hypothetical protein